MKWPKTFKIKSKIKKNYTRYLTISSIELLENIFKKKNFKINLSIPYKVFSYELDYSQKIAIFCIQKEENILVSSETSYGKTSIAEYAIAFSLPKKKIIYTCPIKALSNQKFKDLSIQFPSIGIITGDIVINSSAKCLIMTTEILRSLLFRNKFYISKINSIILDEVHYIGDKNRGFIWEEIFLFLPKKIKLICLSATIPNFREFSEWVVGVRKTKLHFIQSFDRPVQLRFYVFTEFNPRILLITNRKSTIVNKKLEKAFSFHKKKKKTLANSKLNKIIRKLFYRKFGPIIVFTFNKKKCCKFAMTNFGYFLCKKFEILLIKSLLFKIFEFVPKKCKMISQLNVIVSFLKKGIGIHHSGILPLLRELTEILFHVNLIKILFATETFSIGLNLSTKTVIFSTLKKYDGSVSRVINREEFIQMGGRAGRKGIDKKGIIIAVVDHGLNKMNIKRIFQGRSNALTSMFHLNTNMLLFFFQNIKSISESFIFESFTIFQNHLFLGFKKRVFVFFFQRYCLFIFPKKYKFQLLLNFFSFGKIVFFYHYIVCRMSLFSIKTFLYIPNSDEKEKKFKKKKKLFLSHSYSNYFFVQFLLKKILKKKKIISSINFSKSFSFFNWFFFRKNIIFDLIEIGGKFSKSYRNLICVFFHILICFNFLGSKKSNNLKKDISFLCWIKNFFRKLSNKNLYRIFCQKKCSFDKEWINFKKIFFRLKLIHINNTLTRKGKACWELNFEDNIILLEMIFRNIFANLSENLTFALLSAFFMNRKQKNICVHFHLVKLFQSCRKFFFSLKKMFSFCYLKVNLTKFAENSKIEIMNIIYEWYIEENFSKIEKNEIFFEGIIEKYVKIIQEILKQLCKICEILGDVNLAFKFENCRSKSQKKFNVFKSIHY